MPPRLQDREDELHRDAIRTTGLQDFGEPDYRAGLRVLLRAFDTDTQLTEVGRQFAYASVLSTLTARLHTQRGWSEHPGVRAATPIERPLVITVIPRTGTTALHKLLSMDPQFQGLEHWLTETPMIRPAREDWEAHPSYRASLANLDAYFTLMPEMRKAHDMVAGEVDECLEVLRQSFVSNRFGAGAHVPTYDSWFFEQSERGSYNRYVDVLRLIGAAEPRKRWLLKNPGHLAQMGCLLEVFPDACVVLTHRDPLKSIPSLCSTLHMARRMFEGEAARADVIGPRECRYWRQALDSAAQVRRNRPTQFFDVDHRRFATDPLATVRSIYAFFGLELSALAQERMQSWIAAAPTSRHGQHHYNLENFGLTAQGLREEFAGYRAEFGFH